MPQGERLGRRQVKRLALVFDAFDEAHRLTELARQNEAEKLRAKRETLEEYAGSLAVLAGDAVVVRFSDRSPQYINADAPWPVPPAEYRIGRIDTHKERARRGVPGLIYPIVWLDLQGETDIVRYGALLTTLRRATAAETEAVQRSREV